MSRFVSNLQVNGFQLLDARLQNVAGDPGSPAAGQVWFDTTNNRFRLRKNASTTQTLRDTGTTIVNGDIDAAAAIALSKLATDPLARANHTGSQLASTISNFDTQVRTSRLDQMAAPTAAVALGSQQITGLADGTATGDAVNKGQLDAVSAGLDPKASVRVASTANVAIPPGGASLAIDGVTLANGDRVLLKNQSTGSQNGIYVVGGVGSSVTLTRSTDADTSAEVTSGLYVFVTEGSTLDNTGWTLTTNDPITLGTTALTFVQFAGASAIIAGAGLLQTGSTFDVVAADASLTVNADSITVGNVPVTKGGTGATTGNAALTNLGGVKQYATLLGDGVATSFTISGFSINISTADVSVTVWERSAGVRTKVEPDVTVDETTFDVTISGFATAPATNGLRVVIQGKT